MGLFGIERIGYAALVVWITRLNVHGAYLLQEIALLITHLLIKATYFCQPLVLVYVWRDIIARSGPVGFQHFLYDLMTHKGRIQPTPILTEKLAQIEVICRNVKPILHFFFSGHIPL